MPAPSYPTGTLPPAAVAERFQSLRGLSVALLVLFILSALALVWSAIALFVRSGKVADFRDGGDVSFSDLSAADDAVSSGLGFTILLGIAVFVLLIIWLWRAYSNTRVFGAAPWRFGRGWTIGAWFIPFANFVIPKMLINDAWRGADRDAPGNPQWRKLPVAAIITLWWFSYVIAVFLLARGQRGVRRRGHEPGHARRDRRGDGRDRTGGRGRCRPRRGVHPQAVAPAARARSRFGTYLIDRGHSE